MSEAAHAPCRTASAEVAMLPLPEALAKRFSDVTAFCQGQVGTGYRARSEASGTRGMLKLVNDGAAGKDAERSRLKRELRKQATIDHGALARIYDGGETDGRLWLFREFAPGESLRLRLAREGRLSVPDALAITAQVALALDELHRVGLLHRDLKPGHIIVDGTADGPARVQVIDASLSARHDGMFELRGTPSYMSPEQAQGQLCSYRSDLYAVGCVLHEMLTGKPPFEGDLKAVLGAHRDTIPPPPDVALPTGIAQLLAQLLHKEPRQRPFSAKQVWRALQSELPEGTPTPSRRGGSAGPLPYASSAPPNPSAAPVPPPAELAPSAPISSPRPASLAPRADDTQELSIQDLAPLTGESPLSDGPRRDDTQELSLQDLAPLTGETELPSPAKPSPAGRGDMTQELSTQELTALRVDGAFPRDENTQELRTEELSQLAIDAIEEAEADGPARGRDETQQISTQELSELVIDEAVAGVVRAEPSNAGAGSVTGDASSLPPPVPPDSQGPRSRGPRKSAPNPSLPPPVPGAESSRPPPPPAAAAADVTDEADLEDGDLPDEGLSNQDNQDNQDDQDLDASAVAEAQAAFEDASDAELSEADFAAAKAAFKEQAELEGETELEDQDAGRAATEPEGSSPPGIGEDEGDGDRASGADGGGAERAKVDFDVESLFADEGQAPDASEGSDDTEAASPATADELPTTEYQRDEVAAMVAQAPDQARADGSDGGLLSGRLPWIAVAVLAWLALILWWVGRSEPHAATVNPAKPATAAAPTAAAPTPPKTEQPPRDPQPSAPSDGTDGLAPAPTRDAGADAARGDQGAATPVDTTAGLDSGDAIGSADGRDAAATEHPEDAAITADGAPQPSQTEQAEPAAGARQAAGSAQAEPAPKAATGPAAGGLRQPQAPRKTAKQHKDEARAHYGRKRYAKAAAAYRRAAALAPKDAGAHAGLGASQLGLGQVKAAVAAYQRAVALKPKVSGFHAALGRAHYRAGNRKKAIASYRQAVRLDPKNTAAKAALKHLTSGSP